MDEQLIRDMAAAELVKRLRALLGDRLTTGVRDIGVGPQFVYMVADKAYTLEAATREFLLPKEEERTPSELTVTVVHAKKPADVTFSTTDPEVDPAVTLLADEFANKGSNLAPPALPPVKAAALPKPPITVAEYQAEKAADKVATFGKTRGGFLKHTDDGTIPLF